MATQPTSTSAGQELTPEVNGVRHGLITAAVLCVYTLIAAFAGFFSHIEAGSVDVVILMVGSTIAIRNFSRVRGKTMPYLGGYGTGIITALIASIVLGVLVFIIITLMSKSIDLTQIQNIFGDSYSTIIAVLAIVLMGAMTGVLTSLVAMQYYKVQVSDPLQMMEER